MNIQFKLAEEKDILELIQVQNEAFYTDYLIYGRSPEYKRSYESMLNDVVKNIVYKIVIDDKLVGDIIVKNQGQGTYTLDSLCVIPQFENRGIGKAAIQFIEEVTTDAAHWIATTPADKRRNNSFYKKAGYSRINEYMDGDIRLAVLEKNLSA